MSNLPAHQQQAVDVMHEAARNYVIAKFQSRKVSEIPVSEREQKIAGLVTNLLADAGYKDASDPKVIIHLTQRIHEDMIGRFKHLTLAELKMALNEGVRGGYGQFIGINITTVNNWLKSFETSEMRKMALIDFNTRLSHPIPKVDITPEQAEKVVQKACIEAYEAFKKDGYLPYCSKVVYDYLKKKLGIKWSDGERKAIEDEAALFYNSKLRADGYGKKIIETPIGLILEKKRVALKYYFNKLKQNNDSITFN